MHARPIKRCTAGNASAAYSALWTLQWPALGWRKGTLLHILQSGERGQLVRAWPAAEAEHCTESAPEAAASRAVEARHRRGRQQHRGDRH